GPELPPPAAAGAASRRRPGARPLRRCWRRGSGARGPRRGRDPGPRGGARRGGDPGTAGLTAAHVAYVIYTSGSTGTPKAVLVEHRGVVNMTQAQMDLFEVSPASRVVQFAPLSFDASIWEICMALASGAALHLPVAEERADAAAFQEFLARSAITHATLPPAFLQASLEVERRISVETLILAGEAPRLALFEGPRA